MLSVYLNSRNMFVDQGGLHQNREVSSILQTQVENSLISVSGLVKFDAAQTRRNFTQVGIGKPKCFDVISL